MRTGLLLVCAVAVTAVLVPRAGMAPALAQKGDAGDGRAAAHRPGRDPDASLRSPAAEGIVPGLRPQSLQEPPGRGPADSGGPDGFGYTWDDTVAFDWLDARALGTNSGLYGGDAYMGPVDLGFTFPFYEYNYTEVFLSTKGLISFGQGTDEWSNGPLPRRGLPDNLIAAFWDDLGMYRGSRPKAGIYTYRGGTAPGRYFVVQWHQADEWSGEGDTGDEDANLTFEIILHESGDIVFQYLSLSGYLEDATVGIEDDVGVEGLQYLHNAPGLGDRKAIRFNRPAAAARAKAWPLDQGSHTRADQEIDFLLKIRNSGELGADTYDLTASSTWPLTFYGADGTTPLADTDADGQVDTGPLDQGSTVSIIARVQTPAGANVGDGQVSRVTVQSSQDSARSRTAELAAAVPPPFAQVYRDSVDEALSLYLAHPWARAVRRVAVGQIVPRTLAVAETPDGFVSVWVQARQAARAWVGEVHCVFLDHYGEVAYQPAKLADHSDATFQTYDETPVVAVAPNGRIGVAWHRWLYDQDTGQSNYNVYFAVLKAGGRLAYGPVNLTRNNDWGAWGDENWPFIGSVRIAAAGSNRFTLVWHHQHDTQAGPVDDLAYAVYTTSGDEIRGPGKLTNDPPGWADGHYGVNIASVGEGTMLSWVRSGEGAGVYYALLDGGGNVVRGPVNLGWDGAGTWYDSTDLVQLQNGHVVIAWVKNARIRFAVLDEAYNVISWNTELANPAASTGGRFLSVAAAGQQAVLTWMDFDWTTRLHLYYALIDSQGAVITGPMIFRTSEASRPNIETSQVGYGNSSYSWRPPKGVDGTVRLGGSLFFGEPGGMAAMGVGYANHAAHTATGVTLTATLDPALSYVADTSGVTPTISGSEVTWLVPDLALLERREFRLSVAVPGAAKLGTRYRVALALDSEGPEINPADNVAQADVMAARHLFLPLVDRR